MFFSVIPGTGTEADCMLDLKASATSRESSDHTQRTTARLEVNNIPGQKPVRKPCPKFVTAAASEEGARKSGDFFLFSFLL